ncbi:MAG: mechanosensitive ion channel family protein [Acidimicrobiales bacterium]
MRALITAAVSIVVGLGGGALLAPLVRRLLSRPSLPEAVRAVANAAASFVFWIVVAAGVVVAMGSSATAELQTIPTKVITYFPKVITAGVLLLGGKVAAEMVSLAVGRTVIKATGEPRPALTRAVRTIVTAAAVLLAVGQLGIDTTIVNMVLAGLVFGAALASALLIGLGGRNVARELAAGRYLRRLVRPGDRLAVDTFAGVVRAVHPVTVELELADGQVVHLPHERILNGAPHIVRAETAPS